jgi:hypothetical protein
MTNDECRMTNDWRFRHSSLVNSLAPRPFHVKRLRGLRRLAVIGQSRVTRETHNLRPLCRLFHVEPATA